MPAYIYHVIAKKEERLVLVCDIFISSLCTRKCKSDNYIRIF